MGRSRYKIVDNQPYFVTCTVLGWLPVFTRPETAAIILSTLQFFQKQGLQIYAYVILEKHLHLVVQSENLQRDLSRFKSYTAKQLIKYLQQHQVQRILEQLQMYKKSHKHDRQYQFWQEGLHPQSIQSHAILAQKVNYIHQNPVKRGYVDKAEHWRYSSARNYQGSEGLLEINKDW